MGLNQGSTLVIFVSVIVTCSQNLGQLFVYGEYYVIVIVS